MKDAKNLTVRGDPKGFQMPRATIQKAAKMTEANHCPICGGAFFAPKRFALMYDPQRKEKEEIRAVVQQNAPPVPIQNPCELWIFAYLRIPKSIPQWKRPLIEKGFIRPRVKPDLTNILKLYEDTLTHIWFQDDSLVTDTVLKKRYSDTPRVEIFIRELMDVGHLKKEQALAMIESNQESLFDEDEIVNG